MTASPTLLDGLSEVADRYDAVLCDVWGVVHNGRESFASACEALVRFGQTRGPVVLISNAPRPGASIVSQLKELHVPREAWSAIVTSGDATRQELQRRAPGPAWALGPERDAPLYEGLALEFAETPDQAAFISCTGLFDDEVETPEDYRERLGACAARKLPFICANPDRVVQRGDRLIYCAGALADLYEALGGEALMAGKPYKPIYDLALAEADRLAGRPLDKRRVLAIGDGLPTDVLGANREDLDLLFVAEGIHAAELMGEDDRLSIERVRAFLDQSGARATYAQAELRW